MTDFRLSHSETLSFIKCYKQNEQLWNCRSHLYTRSDLKKKAWEKIAKKFGRDIKDVKMKMKSLRSAYVTEKKKVDETKKTGVYHPQLFYYNAFSFLDDVIVVRKTKNNVLDDSLEQESEEREDDEYGDNVMLSNYGDPMLASTSSKGREPSTMTKYDEGINALINTTSQVPKLDEQVKFTDFGRCIASQLKDLPPIEATAAMSDLQKTMSHHIICSLSKQLRTSSKSSSSECNDLLHCAMMNSDIFDTEKFCSEFIDYDCTLSGEDMRRIEKKVAPLVSVDNSVENSHNHCICTLSKNLM